MLKAGYSSSILRVFVLFVFVLIFLTNYSCGNKTTKSITKDPILYNSEKEMQEQIAEDIKAKTFRNSDSTWGFTIYVNGRIYIHQQAMTGSKSISGFLIESDADKTSELVVKKIKNHISPETVSEKELDSLGITVNKKSSK
jgi:hypothetical protein